MDDILIMLIVVMVSRVYKYVKTYQMVHFQYVQPTVCQLYFIKAVKTTTTKNDVWWTWKMMIWGLCIVGILAGSTYNTVNMKGFPEDLAPTWTHEN